jgi:hypothetical protein
MQNGNWQARAIAANKAFFQTGVDLTEVSKWTEAFNKTRE